MSLQQSVGQLSLSSKCKGQTDEAGTRQTINAHDLGAPQTEEQVQKTIRVPLSTRSMNQLTPSETYEVTHPVMPGTP
jgi:hypothetical protein